MQPDKQTVADARFIEWMHLNLGHAAQHFGLTLTGLRPHPNRRASVRWRLRTIGVPATSPAGPRWLRVVTEFSEWAQGDPWTGNIDANALTGIPKTVSGQPGPIFSPEQAARQGDRRLTPLPVLMYLH